MNSDKERSEVRKTVQEHFIRYSCRSGIVIRHEVLLFDNGNNYSSETYIGESKTLYFWRSFVTQFLLYDYIGTMKTKVTRIVERGRGIVAQS